VSAPGAEEDHPFSIKNSAAATAVQEDVGHGILNMQWHFVLRIAYAVFTILGGMFRASVHVWMECIGMEHP